MKVYVVLRHNKDGSIQGIEAVFINDQSAHEYVLRNNATRILSTEVRNVS